MHIERQHTQPIRRVLLGHERTSAVAIGLALSMVACGADSEPTALHGGTSGTGWLTTGGVHETTTGDTTTGGNVGGDTSTPAGTSGVSSGGALTTGDRGLRDGGVADGGDAPVVTATTGGVAADAGRRDAATDGGAPDASMPDRSGDAGPDGAVQPDPTCALPATFRWTGGPPLAQPKNGAVSMKDFTHVFHDGTHILYFTTFDTNWGSGMMTFGDWSEASAAPQHATRFGVAPTLFYFTPKDVWVLAYQWGRYKFSYRTSSDPTDPNGWSEERSLYNTPLPPDGTGPIDQTVICDDSRCFLYYAGDNGHIYKSSLPIDDFPGEFPGAQDSGIVGTTQNLFEGVQVYRVQGSDQYLMIVEAQGPARYFRAWTATDLEGPWVHLTDEFAIKRNVAFTTDWTNDISHGDIVRASPDETFPVDPCNLQMVFQGRDPRVNTSYGRLPYRLGLITHEGD